MDSSFNTQKGEVERRSWCEYVQSTNVVTIDNVGANTYKHPLCNPGAFEYGRFGPIIPHRGVNERAVVIRMATTGLLRRNILSRQSDCASWSEVPNPTDR